MRRHWSLVLILLVGVLAACGTTPPDTGNVGGGDGGD